MTTATVNTATGRPDNHVAQRRQYCPEAALRALSGAPAPPCGSMRDRMMGNSVIATRTAVAVTMSPAMPMERISLTGTNNIAAKPIATADPEMAMVRPACRLASLAAARLDMPLSNAS